MKAITTATPGQLGAVAALCPACGTALTLRHGELWCMAQHGKVTSCCDGER